MTYHGRCQCGAISATITGEPLVVRQCWCRQCQQVAAGGPTNNAIFQTADIGLTGTLATNSYDAASGNRITQSFCGACGTPVMSQSSARPQFRVIRLGFLNADHRLRPSSAIWTDDAADPELIDPRLERIPGQPPPPNAPALS